MTNSPCHCTRMRQAAAATTAFYDAALSPVGLQITQFRMLRVIARLGRPSLSELADSLDIDRSTAGRNVRVLERAGFASMQRDEADSRSRCVALTDDGKNKLKAAQPIWEAAQAQLDELFSTIDLSALTATIKGLAPTDTERPTP